MTAVWVIWFLLLLAQVTMAVLLCWWVYVIEDVPNETLSTLQGKDDGRYEGELGAETLTIAAPPALNRMLDHSFQATLLRLPRDAWHITDGRLVVGRDGTTTWCRQDPATIPPTCPDEAPVPIDVMISPADTGGGWAVIGGPLAARVSERRVVELAVLPRSTWRGSSLRGATRHEAVLRHVWDRRGEVELELPADVQEVPSVQIFHGTLFENDLTRLASCRELPLHRCAAGTSRCCAHGT